MKPIWISIVAFCTYPCLGAATTPNQAEEIVRRSVANTNADWSAAPQYDFTERDVVSQGGSRSVKTYRVIMLDGSPYNELIAINGEPLPAAQAAAEKQKLEQETSRRGRESTADSRKRIAEYLRERRQDRELMSEMAKAFDFKLAGEETLDGRRCFVLIATPKTGYQPTSRETQVLKGMRGKMWVDEKAFQWVKVHAEVFRPVNFGLFIARVKPGTEFTLEQKPFQGNLWLPSHFSMNLNARILILSRRSTDDETYTDYHHSSSAIAANTR